MIYLKSKEVLTVENYTAQEIADWFVIYNQKFVEAEESEPITPLKIQKLLYYAQGAYLALTDHPLFTDEIEKWDKGPVVPSIYREYRPLGSRGIDPVSDCIAPIGDFDNQLLTAIYDKYNKFSAFGLSNKTHNEDPWKQANRNGIISKDSIQKYFKEYVYADDKFLANTPVATVFPNEWYDQSEDDYWEACV
jgi:uncharacterized phage-associated protein